VDGNNEAVSTAYTIAPTGITPTQMAILAVYPAMSPDGTLALTPGGQLLDLPGGTATSPAATGLTGNLGQPAFSPDGAMLSFNSGQKLSVASFDRTTSAFGAATLIADDTGQPAPTQPGWPAFFPDSKSVVYHRQIVQSVEDNMATRAGSQAQIYWTSGSSPADVTPLDNLNGQGYLPKLPAPGTLSCLADGHQVAAGPAGTGTTVPAPNLDHANDANMNYEPTVNPIGSGGYAWVVFTSRRMYGNVATIPPYCSDPRGVDLISNITTKKLWVAAVDLDQAPGTDSSHPAFYLPAQELLAGNARAFWVLDPCQADGATCETGDQCCNGYCEPNGTGGALICSSTPPAGSCSGLQEKCTVASDCCDTKNICLNGFCALKQPG
jgi:hypothetical protein